MLLTQLLSSITPTGKPFSSSEPVKDPSGALFCHYCKAKDQVIKSCKVRKPYPKCQKFGHNARKCQSGKSYLGNAKPNTSTPVSLVNVSFPTLASNKRSLAMPRKFVRFASPTADPSPSNTFSIAEQLKITSAQLSLLDLIHLSPLLQ